MLPLPVTGVKSRLLGNPLFKNHVKQIPLLGDCYCCRFQAREVHVALSGDGRHMEGLLATQMQQERTCKITYLFSIQGTGICTYMNGGFLW